MRQVILALALATGVAAAQAAEVKTVAADGTVDEAMDRLEAAVTEAGATVFARIDHAAGADKVGEDLAPMQLLVFGNPKLGTPALQDAPHAGLVLPLRVLAYEDGAGDVWLAYQDPAEMLDEIGGNRDADHVGAIAGALEKLTAAAAGGG